MLGNKFNPTRCDVENNKLIYWFNGQMNYRSIETVKEFEKLLFPVGTYFLNNHYDLLPKHIKDEYKRPLKATTTNTNGVQLTGTGAGNTLSDLPKFNTTEANGLIVRTATQTLLDAKMLPPSKQLFKELLHTNELCILFADTNVGKSILAAQIADTVSRGSTQYGFNCDSEPLKVGYFDFELSDIQLYKRYSNQDDEPHKFCDNFYRVTVNIDAEQPKDVTIEDYIATQIESSILEHQFNFVIIDNISYLKHDTTTTKDATPLMRLLNNIKRKYSITMIVIAHTPKRDTTKPLTMNDLAGSRALLSFADSCFAIGTSQQDNAIRYIKQLKARYTEILYDGNNVIVCTLQKDNSNLCFDFNNFGKESDHLKVLSEDETTKLGNDIIDSYLRGTSYRDIAKNLNCSLRKVQTEITKYKEQQGLSDF